MINNKEGPPVAQAVPVGGGHQGVYVAQAVPVNAQPGQYGSPNYYSNSGQYQYSNVPITGQPAYNVHTTYPTNAATVYSGSRYCGPITIIVALLFAFFIGPFALLFFLCPLDEEPPRVIYYNQGEASTYSRH